MWSLSLQTVCLGLAQSLEPGLGAPDVPRRGDNSDHKSLPLGTASAGHPRGWSRAVGSSLAVPPEAGSILRPDRSDCWPREEATKAKAAKPLCHWSGATSPRSPLHGRCPGVGVPRPGAPLAFVPAMASPEVAPATQKEAAVTRLDSAGAPCPTVGGRGRKPLSPLRPRRRLL